MRKETKTLTFYFSQSGRLYQKDKTIFFQGAVSLVWQMAERDYLNNDLHLRALSPCVTLCSSKWTLNQKPA